MAGKTQNAKAKTQENDCSIDPSVTGSRGNTGKGAKLLDLLERTVN